MKVFVYFSVVVAIFFVASKAEMVRRASSNVIEVTGDFSKGMADVISPRGNYVKFFSFDSDNWSLDAKIFRKTAQGFKSVFFLLYDCVNMDQYCPDDVTQTTLRVYRNGELKNTEENPHITSQGISKHVVDLLNSL